MCECADETAVKKMCELRDQFAHPHIRTSAN